MSKSIILPNRSYVQRQKAYNTFHTVDAKIGGKSFFYNIYKDYRVNYHSFLNVLSYCISKYHEQGHTKLIQTLLIP